MLLIGIIIGAMVGIVATFEPLLSTLGILIALIFPVNAGIGIVIGFLAVSSITKYIGGVITPSIENTNKEIKNNVVKKGKGLQLATKAMEYHYITIIASLVLGIVVNMTIVKTTIVPVGIFMLAVSIISLGIGWLTYIFNGEKIGEKLIVTLLLGVAAYIAITTQGAKGTTILFTSLFSLNAAIGNLSKKEERIGEQKEEKNTSVEKLPWGLSIISGVMSSTMVGFPTAAVEKLLTNKTKKNKKGKKKVQDNEVHETLVGAIISGVQTGLGLFLFLVQGMALNLGPV